MRHLGSSVGVAAPSTHALARLGACGLLCASLSCSGEGGDSSDSRTVVPARAQEGTLARYVATFADGHSERWVSLRSDDGSATRRLTFDQPPSSESGARLRVWAEVQGEALHVARFEELSPPPAPRPDRTYEASKQDTYAFVLVDTGGGVGITAAQAQAAFFSTAATDKSFADFYSESSYGQYTVTGDVVGPYTYADTNCNTDGMANTIEPMIGKTYNHYVYYIGQKESACTWVGLAEEGSITRPQHRTWLNAADGCVVTAQEPGHNLGLMHSNTITCPGASFSSDVGSSCTIKEYGDKLTPMGSGCHQLNAYEKWYQQWLAGCNAVKVGASGTFNLVPHETQCPGAVQVLQIPLPASQNIQDPENDTDTLANYYVELRAPGGTFDTTLAAGVYVYAAADVPTADTAGHTYILDMNPQTSAFDPLSQGQTYTDPGGAITITLVSVSASGATVQVTVPGGTGASTCIDGTTLTGSGPLACSSSGSSSGSGSGSSSGSSSSGSSSGASSGSTSGSSSGSGGPGDAGGAGGGNSDSGGSSGGSSGSSGSGIDGSPGGSSTGSGSNGSTGSSSSGGSGGLPAGSGSSTGSGSGGSDAGGATTFDSFRRTAQVARATRWVPHRARALTPSQRGRASAC
jgi:hypothetical protein